MPLLIDMEITAVTITAAVIFVLVGWVIFRFFFRLLKHFIIAGALAVVVAIFWYQPWNSFAPTIKPDVGKFAYGASSKNFLGVVVADDRENNNWIVEKSGLRMKYAKNRVILKETTAPAP